MCAPPACIGPEEPRELFWSLHAGNQPQIENKPKLEAVPFIRHRSASGLARFALDPRLECTGCPEAGWCRSCLPRKLQEAQSSVFQLPGSASSWPHGALYLITLLPGCWEGSSGGRTPLPEQESSMPVYSRLRPTFLSSCF